MRQLLLGRVSSTARKRRRWSGELPPRFAPLVSHQRCAPNRRTLACFHPAPKSGYHLADSRYAGYRRQIWPLKMKYGVISADDHVQEAPDVWTNRMVSIGPP